MEVEGKLSIDTASLSKVVDKLESNRKFFVNSLPRCLFSWDIVHFSKKHVNIINTVIKTCNGSKCRNI